MILLHFCGIEKRWHEAISFTIRTAGDLALAHFLDDGAEYVTDDWAENGQNNDNNNCNQNEDQSIFYEALAFFILWTIQHDNSSKIR